MYSFIGSALCFSKYIDLQVCVGVWRNFRYHAFLYMVCLCTALPIWVKISSQWCIKKCTVHQQCVYCRMTSRPVNSRTTPLRGGVHDMNCSSADAVQSTHSIRGRETGWVGDWLQCFLQNEVLSLVWCRSRGRWYCISVATWTKWVHFVFPPFFPLCIHTENTWCLWHYYEATSKQSVVS